MLGKKRTIKKKEKRKKQMIFWAAQGLSHYPVAPLPERPAALFEGQKWTLPCFYPLLTMDSFMLLFEATVSPLCYLKCFHSFGYCPSLPYRLIQQIIAYFAEKRTPFNWQHPTELMEVMHEYFNLEP